MRGSGETKDLGNELAAARTFVLWWFDAIGMRDICNDDITAAGNQMSAKCVIDGNQSCGQRAASGG